jgi:hypothetical protein
MKYIEYLEEAQKALREENKQKAINIITERLREIEMSRKILEKMESQFTELLEKDV